LGGCKLDYQKKLEEIRKIGIISTDDDIHFEHIYDVLNELFDYKYKLYQGGTKKFNNWKVLWFPKLIFNYYGEKRPLAKKWKNWFKDSKQDLLFEEYLEGTTDGEYSYWENIKLERAVFVVFIDNNIRKLCYKFYGIFRFKKHEENTSVFERISTELDIEKWIKDKR
jgi:hypothetical protein